MLKPSTIVLLVIAEGKVRLKEEKITMHENILKNIDIVALQKEYGILKNSNGNYRCRKCLMVDGYSEEEKNCRWCGNELREMDKV